MHVRTVSWQSVAKLWTLNRNIQFIYPDVPQNGQLNDAQKETLEYIKAHEGLSATSIADGLGKPYRTIIKHIAKLQSLGLIVRVGSKKTGGYKYV